MDYINKLQIRINLIQEDKSTGISASELEARYKSDLIDLLNGLWDSEAPESNERRSLLRDTMTVVERWGVPKVQGKRPYELPAPSPVIFSTSQVLDKLQSLLTAYS